ncbi:MAG: DNA-processing protein DprA [Gammaproteobacteria bacterium]|nr:DNA-processing protein DprA [Gammaproteobacteria bacterium]
MAYRDSQSQPYPTSAESFSAQPFVAELFVAEPGSVKQSTNTANAWLALSLVRGMHARLFHQLLNKFQTVENILASDKASLGAAGLKHNIVSGIIKCAEGMPDQALNDSLNWLEAPNHNLLTCQSKLYPPLLKAIPDPPPILYVCGQPDYLHLPQIAIVGSRQPSSGGLRNARRFARELAASGFGITSGLARGIDAQGHSGALDIKGKTVAVLGNGIDKVYPACNHALYEQIKEQGALVSEFPPGMPPLRENFPRRNRIISGLSLGVLVVEAGEKSGSMITARQALEQGREVFAIPGSIHNPVARGCHKLINEGAKLVQNAADIVDECGGLLAGIATMGSTGQDHEALTKRPLPTGDLGKIFNAIGYDIVTPDELVLATSLAIHDINAALIELEMQGLISRERTGYIRLPAM